MLRVLRDNWAGVGIQFLLTSWCAGAGAGRGATIWGLHSRLRLCDGRAAAAGALAAAHPPQLALLIWKAVRRGAYALHVCLGRRHSTWYGAHPLFSQGPWLCGCWPAG